LADASFRVLPWGTGEDFNFAQRLLIRDQVARGASIAIKGIPHT
jgi:hypothetical protein